MYDPLGSGNFRVPDVRILSERLILDGAIGTKLWPPLQLLQQRSDQHELVHANLNRLRSITNAYGAEQIVSYDIEDRGIYLTGANGVTITNTYDDLGRLRTRLYPDGGGESFGYSARGLIAYTNQLGFTNFYTYDEAGRKIFETNANWDATCDIERGSDRAAHSFSWA